MQPLTLPYSPEFEPRARPDEGRTTLAEIARISGGSERTAWDDVFSTGGLRNRQVRDLILPLAIILLCLHLVEIAGRRLLLFAEAPVWLRTHLPSVARLRRARAPVGANHESWWSRLRRRGSPSTRPSEEAAVTAVETTPDPGAVSDAMARAKSKARNRVER